MKSAKLMIALLLLLFTGLLTAQKEKDKDIPRSAMGKELGLNDRAGGVHNAGNIGLFFENRGKLYPRRITQGPSGEWPLHSGKHYIYRINPMVAIKGKTPAETNVIQGRYTANEEFEAVGGYNNNSGSKIAFSDDPNSWPATGWPVKDATGQPVFKSDQDSYCVYGDSTNSKKVLGVQVAQTGYQYGVGFAQNILFFKYDIINKGNEDLNDVYFGLYTDIDVGNVSGGDPEYADDKFGYDKSNNFVYFYDSKGYSTEWPDRTTGYFGVSFLKTPKVNGVELGLTDMHYNLYDDDRDLDTIQYGIFSSSPSLYASSLGSKYFHIGNQTSLHFDDTSAIPATGLDLVANLGSGPYFLKKGDTLSFYTAIIAGVTLPEAIKNAEQAKKIMANNFEISKPPVTPKLGGSSADKRNILYWDAAAEKTRDSYSGQYDFEGYRLYRSMDNGVTWKLLADYDLQNEIGIDKGLQYSYTDTAVTNGFEYWYSVTAYDRGDSAVASLESPLGKTAGAVNLAILTPNAPSLGRVPVGSVPAVQVGTGKSNYQVKANPVDFDSLGKKSYTLGFAFTSATSRGVLKTRATVIITDSNQTKPERYGIAFRAPNKFDLVNLTTGLNIRTDLAYNYLSANQVVTVTGAGIRIKLEDSATTPQEFLPKNGDLLTVGFSVYGINNNGDTVIPTRIFQPGKPIAANDGFIVSIDKPYQIKSINRVGGSDNMTLTGTVTNDAVVKNAMYVLTTTAKYNGYISAVIDTALGDTNKAKIKLDSLVSPAAFTINGLTFRLEFSNTNPPAPGNIFSVESIIPSINLKDKFKVTLTGASTNKAAIASGLSKIRVVPNPYVVSSLYEPEFGELRKEPLRKIKFINLPPECTIYLFAVDGTLIKTLYHSSVSGSEDWDLRAEGGREIAAGVYFYVVKAPEGEYKERFAVIK